MSGLHRATFLTLAPVLVAASLVSAPAWAQTGPLTGMVTGLDIDRIADIARVYGPAERQFEDIEDGPWIRAEMDGVVYTISFLNCTNGQNCSSVQFRAWWRSEGDIPIEAMNDWNRERRFSDAYIDDRGNATIEFDVNLAGGVTAVNFDDSVQWWQAVLREFRSTVVEPDGTAGTPPMPPTPPALSK